MNKQTRYISAFLLGGLSGFPTAGTAQQPSATELSARIDALVAEPISESRIAGLSIAVVRGTDTILVRGYGSADVELDVETPPDAVYEIGSVTKQFTAVALLMLEEAGRLSLDDPLTKWLPDYPLGDRSLTLRRLLDHTSGIKGYTEMGTVWSDIVPLGFPQLGNDRARRDTLVALFAAEPFEFEPGGALIYNNSAYFLLGLIIEDVSGQSYEDFVEQRLFAAAGMDDSRYCHKDELIPRRALGYDPTPDGLRPAAHLDHLWPYSAGSLCSTVRDLVKWNQALHGDGSGGSLLGAEAYRSLITPEPLTDGTKPRYAKGLAITDRTGERRISHGGGIFGFVSDLRYLPEEDLSIVVLINTAGGVSPAGIAARIEDIVLGPARTPLPRRFAGDLEAFAGEFRGPARGTRLIARVSVEEDRQLMVKLGPGSPQPVRWLGGNTFASEATRFTFLRSGESFETLQVDQVTGLYVLARSDR